ncbi:MAG: hypothetical protein QXG48_02570 [Thermofilaceae archaeon]
MSTVKLSIRNLLYDKMKLAEVLSSKLGYERSERARSDYHAKKYPVHCGATVHSVLGCTFQCVYCYLPDMGVSFARAQPYALSGEEMVLALASNPFFLPGLHGTYIALGSLGEPLHPVGAWRTLEYVEVFARYLHNPLQLSTKAVVSEEVARRLGGVSGAPVNPLVTIIALKNWSKLEPAAPNPESRLESIFILRKARLFPMLFLRPLIPGLEEEVIEVMREAKKRGAVATVLGSLRVTASTIVRLKKLGIDVDRILSRLRRPPEGRAQLSVPMNDVKRRLAEEAKTLGIVPLYSACCANTLNVYLRTGNRIPCAGLDFIDGRFCAGCPVDCRSVKVEADCDEVKWAVKEFLNVDARRVEERGYSLLIAVDDARQALRNLRRKRRFKAMLETVYRRRIEIVEGKPA